MKEILKKYVETIDAAIGKILQKDDPNFELITKGVFEIKVVTDSIKDFLKQDEMSDSVEDRTLTDALSVLINQSLLSMQHFFLLISKSKIKGEKPVISIEFQVDEWLSNQQLLCGPISFDSEKEAVSYVEKALNNLAERIKQA